MEPSKSYKMLQELRRTEKVFGATSVEKTIEDSSIKYKLDRSGLKVSIPSGVETDIYNVDICKHTWIDVEDCKLTLGTGKYEIKNRITATNVMLTVVGKAVVEYIQGEGFSVELIGNGFVLMYATSKLCLDDVSIIGEKHRARLMQRRNYDDWKKILTDRIDGRNSPCAFLIRMNGHEALLNEGARHNVFRIISFGGIGDYEISIVKCEEYVEELSDVIGDKSWSNGRNSGTIRVLYDLYGRICFDWLENSYYTELVDVDKFVRVCDIPKDK